MAASSIYWDVLTAVRAAMNSLEVLGGATVRIRRRAALRRGQERAPLVMLVPEAESIGEEQFGGTAFFDYPVNVFFIQGGEHGLVLEDEERMALLLSARQAIRRKLHRALLAGADAVMDCISYDPQPPFDSGAFDDSFDVSAQRFVFRSNEARQEG